MKLSLEELSNILSGRVSEFYRVVREKPSATEEEKKESWSYIVVASKEIDDEIHDRH